MRHEAQSKEKKWIQNALTLVEKDDLTSDDALVWAAFHALTTFDQPLFALAKLVQWKWPDVYGESVHAVMMGGLHLEMALWNTLGDVLEDSGWTTALTEALLVQQILS